MHCSAFFALLSLCSREKQVLNLLHGTSFYLCLYLLTRGFEMTKDKPSPSPAIRA